MKSLMDEYINFTRKKIKKYMRMIFQSQYNEEIVEEYLKTYINSRYYNINKEGKKNRPFYLKISDQLTQKEKSLKTRFKTEEEILLLQHVKKAFYFMLFFDNVRKVENFKTINSIKEVISQIAEIRKNEFKIKTQNNFEISLYEEVASDMLEKEIFLDNFVSDELFLKLTRDRKVDNMYYVKLDYDIKLPAQYSDMAINKVYNEGSISEDKLEVEYILLSVIALKDILNGNFKDCYIAEFKASLFKKKNKLKSIINVLNNQALQDKIYLNVEYEHFIKNREQILELTHKGFNFVITLDDTVKSVEEVEKLKMFKKVIVPTNIKLYKEIMKNKSVLHNIMEKVEE